MRTTMASVSDNDPVLWVHFVLVYIFTFYGLAVIYWNFVQFAELRKQYLQRGR